MRIVSALIAGLALVAAAPAPRTAGWAGIWRNAANSVHIRAYGCGAGMCGTVIWASDKAKADVAARGGELIGAQLFRDFERGGDGIWHGEVYVPDIGQSFAGTIELQGPNTLVGSGCLFAGFGCRTQTWTRLRT